MSILEQIANAVIDGNEDAPRLVDQALAQQVPAGEVLNNGLLAGMTEVGRRFREGEYFIPEVLMSAEVMKASMELLRPQMLAQGVKPTAVAAIGTVKGDLHDIGKNLVSTMLEGAGFEVIDLGVDVPDEKFVEVCRSRNVQLVAMSALLTTTMPQMESAVRRIKSEVQPPPKIMVGGAPVTEEYANKIGADGYGRDAASGAEVAKQLCKVA